MKTIYVTITEFEENGGVLENGRDVYEGLYGRKIGIYEYNEGFEPNRCIIANGVRLHGPDEYYVAIECTPIYK